MATYQASAGADSITVTLYGVAGSYYRVFCYANGNTSGTNLGGAWAYSSTYSAAKVVSDLVPGTTYLISVYTATDTNGSNAVKLGEEYLTLTAPAVTAYYEVSNIAMNSFQFDVYGVAPAAAYWSYFRAFVYLGGSSVYSTPWTAHAVNFTVPVSGLSAGATYTISVYAATSSAGANATPLSGPSSVTTPKNQIALWSWSSSNGNATAEQTQAAYTAITKNGKMTDFSYVVWNDLCAKVNECVQAANSTWWTVMGPSGAATPGYAATLMTAANKTLTALRFNAVRGNIGGRVSTGISPVSAGDKIYGSYFITLSNALNTWIQNLNG